MLKKLGRVVNGYSNFLALLAIDARHAASWRGPVDESKDDDFVRACKVMERGGSTFGKGLLVEIGGCGSSEVWQIGDALVMVEHFTGDDDADIEADFERSIVELPTTKPKLIGPVDVTSGALALIALIEAGAKVDVKQVKARGSLETKFGVVIAVPPGRYQVWRESLRAEGAWGLIQSRVRIVPAGTKVKAGAPIALAAPTPKRRAPQSAAAAGARREVAKWASVATMAIADDGRAFAGQNGGFDVCAWNADGTLAWQRQLAKPPTAGSKWQYEADVALVGADLLVLAKDRAKLLALDPATGKDRRALKIPASRTFAVSPDRTKLVLRVETETQVLAYPSGKVLAKLDQYCNQNCIAISHDNRWLVVNGHEVHIFDLAKLAHVTTFEPPESPWATCFNPAHELVTADDTGLVRVYDPKTGKKLRQGDAAPERRTKPTITAIAASATHVAAARDDGTVALLDSKKLKVVKTFDKHDVTVPDTGSTSLGAVAFSADGKTLWVSAGPKGKKPVGLTAYAL